MDIIISANQGVINTIRDMPKELNEELSAEAVEKLFQLQLEKEDKNDES